MYSLMFAGAVFEDASQLFSFFFFRKSLWKRWKVSKDLQAKSWKRYPPTCIPSLSRRSSWPKNCAFGIKSIYSPKTSSRSCECKSYMRKYLPCCLKYEKGTILNLLLIKVYANAMRNHNLLFGENLSYKIYAFCFKAVCNYSCRLNRLASLQLEANYLNDLAVTMARQPSLMAMAKCPGAPFLLSYLIQPKKERKNKQS